MSVEKGREVAHTTTHAAGRASELAHAILGSTPHTEFEAKAEHKFKHGQHVHGKDIEGKPIPKGSVVDKYDDAGHVIVNDPTKHAHTCNEKDLDFDHADHH